jgi:hypothetical protein
MTSQSLILQSGDIIAAYTANHTQPSHTIHETGIKVFQVNYHDQWICCSRQANSDDHQEILQIELVLKCLRAEQCSMALQTRRDLDAAVLQPKLKEQLHGRAAKQFVKSKSCHCKQLQLNNTSMLTIEVNRLGSTICAAIGKQSHTICIR